MSFGKAVRKLRSRHADLHFVYEAGPCGYEVYRYLADLDLMCDVIAPSLIPREYLRVKSAFGFRDESIYFFNKFHHLTIFFLLLLYSLHSAADGTVFFNVQMLANVFQGFLRYVDACYR